VWLMAATMALCGSLAVGQMIVAPGPEGTLTVTVVGSADGPADWVEVSLSVEGKGATCQEALGVCEEASKAVVAELGTIQVPEENVRLGAPEFGEDAITQVMVQLPGMGDQAGGIKQTVRRNLTVRLGATDPQSLYEAICRVVDIATDAGAALKTAGPVQSVYSQQSVLTFGVNDLKPLRAKAIANGLASAKEVAEATAAASGRKLGEITGVQLSALGADAGYMSLVASIGLPAKPGLAVYNVSLTVTYRLQ